MFLCGSFPQGNYVGNKLSERKFSSAAISSGMLSGDNYLWGICPGAIIEAAIVRGAIFLEGNSLGGIYPGTIFLGGNYPRGQLFGGQFSFGSLVRTLFCKNVLLEISQISQENTCARVSFWNKVAGLRHRLWHRCFFLKFAKFLTALFLQNTFERLLLNFEYWRLSCL